jgi:hypothetical protein
MQYVVINIDGGMAVMLVLVLMSYVSESVHYQLVTN